MDEKIKPEELPQKVIELSKGSSGVIIIPLSYWRSVVAAYESPLMAIVKSASLEVYPIRTYPGRELTFRISRNH